MKKYFTFYLLLLIGLGNLCALHGRSPYRPIDTTIPRIQAHIDGQRCYSLQNSHLEEYPVFKTFDNDYFYAHLLPHEPIIYRYDETKSVNGAVLEELVNGLVQEVLTHKNMFTHFTVLRNRDFNRKKGFGLIIAKFNDYPFVVKLFIETPKSFTQPHAKGFVPLCAFYMGSGINRHLVGFTRIRNLEIINERIAQSPYWSSFIDTPRKWFVLPRANKWMNITGYNIGTKPVIQTSIPSIYCIIADEIRLTRQTSVFNRRDNTICMELCNYLDLWIDPHIDNFMWQDDKLVIVDTEHFPSLVGLKETAKFTGYISWLGCLAGKFVNDILFRDKEMRKLSQTTLNLNAITY